MESTSTAFRLDKIDFTKILKGAEIAVVGALLTYFSSVVANTDFTVHLQNGSVLTLSPLVVALWSVLYNTGRKWVTDHTK